LDRNKVAQPAAVLPSGPVRLYLTQVVLAILGPFFTTSTFERFTTSQLATAQEAFGYTKMKALRRSIKGDKDKGPVTPKSAVAIVPPKKVGGLPLPRIPQASIIPPTGLPHWAPPWSHGKLHINPGAPILMPNPISRLFEPFTITRPVPAKNSAFREVTFSTLSAEKTIKTGTKHAIQLFLTPEVSCP
jgi:hypothetical protein